MAIESTQSTSSAPQENSQVATQIQEKNREEYRAAEQEKEQSAQDNEDARYAREQRELENQARDVGKNISRVA